MGLTVAAELGLSDQKIIFFFLALVICYIRNFSAVFYSLSYVSEAICILLMHLVNFICTQIPLCMSRLNILGILVGALYMNNYGWMSISLWPISLAQYIVL
jgi:hypothetical protein